MIVVSCPTCAKTFRAAPGAVGQPVRCEECGTTFTAAAPARAGGENVPGARAGKGGTSNRPAPPVPSATMSLPPDPPTRQAADFTLDVTADATKPRSIPAAPRLSHRMSGQMPRTLGRFEVRAWVGEGTFAEVFRGFDSRLDREVALKVARPGTLGTQKRIKRFLREARAAGNLRHPNIVPLYETGEDAGRHFLVTAFIHGRTLGTVIKDAGTNGLAPHEAVRLARKLAGALAYAHTLGVVHRDLKPENVMVDEKGEPLLMDFGLAARAEADEGAERLTQQGVALGTPAYMAPEQARGELGAVGPAADQYALGCTLYELLTGRTPFAGPPQVQLLLHQTEEPVRPSRHNRTVPHDLDAICLKCLAKEPKERYPSAETLEEDLDRFLRGEPVLARRQTVRYLAGKFVRRYRRSLAVAAGLLLLTLAGTAGAFVRINAERADAVAASAREQDERKKAEKALADLDQSRKEAQVVRDVVEQANTPLTEDNVRHAPGLSSVHEELAQIRLDGTQRLAKLTPDDPTVEPRLARAYKLLGQICARVGSFDRAKGNLETAGEMFTALAEKRADGREFRLQACRTHIELARLYWDDNRKHATRACLEKALAWLEPELARAPDDSEVAYEVGRAWAMLGGCLPANATKAVKEELADRNAKLFERLIERKYREVDSRAGLTVARYRLVWTRFDGKDQNQLLKELAGIDELDRTAQGLAPLSPYLRGLSVFLHGDKATAHRNAGRFKECVAESEAAVARARDIAKASPHDHIYPGLLAEFVGKLAKDYRRVGRAVDAQTALEEAVQIHESVCNRFPDSAYAASQWVDRRNELAEYFKSGAKALDEIQAKQSELRTLDGTITRARALAVRFPNHHWLQVNYAQTLRTRGEYDDAAKRPEKALPFFLEAADVYRERILTEKDRPDPEFDVPNYVDLLRQAAGCVEHKPEEITRLSRLALDVRQDCVTRAAADSLGTLLVGAGKAHRAAGRFPEAVTAFQQAIEICKPLYDAAPWHWYLQANHGGAFMNLADAYRDMKDYKNEVLANREYLRIVIGPWWGAKVDEFLDPQRPTDLVEADKIRELITRATKAGIKRFTVPCDFSGIKYPFYIYVTDVPPPKHPLADQARWLKEERGGTIPQEVMDSFARLQKIAQENNVSFVDLCVYALGTAADDTKPVTAETLGGTAAVPGPPGKGGRDPLADLKARLVDLKAVLDNSPGDLKTAAEAAAVYQQLGNRLLQSKQPQEAAEMLRGASGLYGRLAAAQPTVLEHRQQLAEVFLLFGKGQVQLKDFDAAYNSWHRRLDVLEQLRLDAPSAAVQAAVAECHALLGDLAELRGDRIESQRCYVCAIREGSGRAANKVALALELAPGLLGLLPKDLAALYTKTKDATPPRKGLELAKAFADAVAQAQAVRTDPASAAMTPLTRLEDAANRYREVADGHRIANRRAEYRAALAAEYEVRVALTAVEPKAHPKSANQKVAAALVESYLDAKETALAAKWYDRTGGAVTLAVLVKLAEFVETGVNTKADPKQAEKYYYLVYYRRGKGALDGGKYEIALNDLKKLCELDQADGEDFNLLGGCLGKLGRWEEAVKTYQRGYKRDPLNRGIALNLIEALIVSGQPKQARELIASLDKKIWAPEPPLAPAVAANLTVLAGLTAIAERLITDDDAPTPGERAVLEFNSVPGLELGWTWDELETWFAKADLPAKKKAAVRRSLDELEGRSPERTTVHFPLAVGAKWTYSQRRTNAPKVDFPDVTFAVVAKEKMKGVECFKVERSSGKEPPVSEHLVVRYNGVYRVGVNGQPLAVPYRVFALPPAKGVTWTQPKEDGHGAIKSRVRSVGETKVPAGAYTDCWAVREETDGAPAGIVRESWYAENVGPVKIEEPAPGGGRGTVVLELKLHDHGQKQKSK